MTLTNRLKAFFIYIFIIILTIKICDISIGLFYKNDAYNKSNINRFIQLRELHPNTDIIRIPADDYMSGTQNLQKKQYRLRTDEDGFIVGPKDFVSTESSKRVDIIFFGGSTTECVWVEEALRFPYLVSQNLVNTEGKNLRVLNAGVSGSNSMHSMFSHLAKGIPHRPQYAVLMHAVNDLSLLSKTLSYWDGPITRKIVVEGQNKIDKGFLYENLRFIKDIIFPNIWINTRYYFHSYVDEIIASDEWALHRERKFEFAQIENTIKQDFKASIKSFIFMTRAWGIEPILMTQFNRVRHSDKFVKNLYIDKKQGVSWNEWVKLYAMANQIIREVSHEEDVLLIDLDILIEPDSRYMYDAVHLNTKGSIKVADIITDFLAENFPKRFKRN